MKKYLSLVVALTIAAGAILPDRASAAAAASSLASSLARANAAPSYVEKSRVVVVRPGRRVWIVRPWHRRPYYGTAIVGGLALGTLLAAGAYYARPAPPAPGTCWYWSNPSRTRGYWDYCD